PACGSGNFVLAVLRRKLATVQARYKTSTFERRHNAMLGLMCIYGIELLPDNTAECRANLVETFDEFVARDKTGDTEVWHRAALSVVAANIVHGDALAMTGADGSSIQFPEWS